MFDAHNAMPKNDTLMHLLDDEGSGTDAEISVLMYLVLKAFYLSAC